MGSEMCIRDRFNSNRTVAQHSPDIPAAVPDGKGRAGDKVWENIPHIHQNTMLRWNSEFPLSDSEKLLNECIYKS